MKNLDEDQLPPDSPLSQLVTRDGKTVSVEIYEDGKGGWILEVVDQYRNSTVWRAAFKRDQDALDAALTVIDEEGIDSLIGLPASETARCVRNPSLPIEELTELDDFLANEAIEETSMDVATLEGFLTAIAIGPQIVMPSKWIPWVWDMVEGVADPVFEDQNQAGRIMSIIMRHYNSVVEAFNNDPASFDPLFWSGGCWGAGEWCEGFLLGFQFNQQEWGQIAVAQPAWLTPFQRLGTEEGRTITHKNNETEKWINEIDASLMKLHGYWKSHSGNPMAGQFKQPFDFPAQKEVFTQVRNSPKVGRNDLCPCGSGKKFKKCCGRDVL